MVRVLRSRYDPVSCSECHLPSRLRFGHTLFSKHRWPALCDTGPL